MKELNIDIADLWNQNKWTCITTNGTVTKGGHCVMGRGNAKLAKDTFPKLSRSLGKAIQSNGNKVFLFPYHRLFTFPVKHNWYETADIDLIKKSFSELIEYLNLLDIKEIYLPRPGCENGKLEWENVRTQLMPLYDERIIFINYKHNKG